MPEKATLGTMKDFKVNMRVSPDLRETVDYLKLLPGGLTGWFDKQLKNVKVDRELMQRLRGLSGEGKDCGTA